MKNLNLACGIFELLIKANVKDIIVCAGARNLPFLHVLEKFEFKVISYFEERSAGFYALGLSEATKNPIAIITTSGTAASELLSAVIEAHYQNIPLILITADRPKYYRGSGAPQAIQQVDLFSSYVEACYDLDVFNEQFDIKWSMTKPLHLNICFDEPLIDVELSAISPFEFHLMKMEPKIEKNNKPILIENNCFVILSQIPSSFQVQVLNFLMKHQLFHIAEAQSGLMNHPELLSTQLNCIEGFSDLFENKYFKSIIRIGGIPTNRLWRDLEKKYFDFEVFNFSHREFSGLSRKSLNLSLKDLDQVVLKKYDTDLQNNQIRENLIRLKAEKNNLLNCFLLSEPSFIARLSQVVGCLPLYIGNSLPIREWDLFNASTAVFPDSQPVFANRGANGIDGQVSTYLGWSKKYHLSFAVIGDLTALYDLASLGLAKKDNGHKIVIINNSGGQIFNRLFKNNHFLNAQNVQFKHWAKMWSWSYIKVQELNRFQDLELFNKENTIIEVIPDSHQTQFFWDSWDKICKNFRSLK